MQAQCPDRQLSEQWAELPSGRPAVGQPGRVRTRRPPRGQENELIGLAGQSAGPFSARLARTSSTWTVDGRPTLATKTLFRSQLSSCCSRRSGFVLCPTVGLRAPSTGSAATACDDVVVADPAARILEEELAGLPVPDLDFASLRQQEAQCSSQMPRSATSCCSSTRASLDPMIRGIGIRSRGTSAFSSGAARSGLEQS